MELQGAHEGDDLAFPAGERLCVALEEGLREVEILEHLDGGEGIGPAIVVDLKPAREVEVILDRAVGQARLLGQEHDLRAEVRCVPIGAGTVLISNGAFSERGQPDDGA